MSEVPPVNIVVPAPPLWLRVLFLVLAVASLLPQVSPALALGAGAVLGLTVGNPFALQSAKISKTLLKACVVGLGFGMSLPAVLEVGRQGIWATALGIFFALGLGLLLTQLLNIERTTGMLVSGGTAICGGSAIAALGPAIGAGAEAMSVSLAIVFLLNGVALYVFPPVGHLLDMTQSQFALWAAIAIHDTSSVVGAASAYGKEALEMDSGNRPRNDLKPTTFLKRLFQLAFDLYSSPRPNHFKATNTRF